MKKPKNNYKMKEQNKKQNEETKNNYKMKEQN